MAKSEKNREFRFQEGGGEGYHVINTSEKFQGKEIEGNKKCSISENRLELREFCRKNIHLKLVTPSLFSLNLLHLPFIFDSLEF